MSIRANFPGEPGIRSTQEQTQLEATARERRRFKSLKDYSAATGQDKHSILVDYDVFVKVSPPGPDPQRFTNQRISISSFGRVRLRLTQVFGFPASTTISWDGRPILEPTNPDGRCLTTDLGRRAQGLRLKAQGSRLKAQKERKSCPVSDVSGRRFSPARWRLWPAPSPVQASSRRRRQRRSWRRCRRSFRIISRSPPSASRSPKPATG